MYAFQITDFTNSVNALLPNYSNTFLFTTPASSTTFNSNYQLADVNVPANTISGNKIKNNSISGQQLASQAVFNTNLSYDLQQFFSYGYSSSQTDSYNQKNSNVPYPCITQQYNSSYPIGFLHTNYNKHNGTNQNYTNYSYYGSSNFFPYSNFSTQIGSGQNPSPSIQFGTNTIYGSTSVANQYGCVGMYNSVGGFVSTITSSAQSIHLAGPTFSSYLVSFGRSGYLNDCVSYIHITGQYVVNSDENLKNNITEKKNYQEQLDKLLKVKIVTYSYGKNYLDRVQEIKQQLQDKGLNDDEKQTLQNELDSLEYNQTRTLQGYTYQNLKECGFNYVISDQQTMSDDFLQKQGIDKEKIQQKQQSNETKTISETAMIPYVIMGIKALNEKIEQHNQRLDIIDQAMMKTHEIINEVSCQTDQKIQDVQQNSLVNSINSDNIDDIKNTLNKLIYQFDQQQNAIKKYQNQIVFLQSQCEQMQSTIEKQQTDITSLKLKTKLIN